MGEPEVVIVKTGSANLASVAAALNRVGALPTISEDPSEIAEARLLVLPGVGTLAAAMSRIDALQLREVLRSRIEQGNPTLAICLGMQMLCAMSEESPDVRGLDLIPETVTRFSQDLRVPQLGWNRIEPEPSCTLLQPGYAYFANSYALMKPGALWSVAWADYGGSFVAALEKDSVLACQFHPELSGTFGLQLIRRWLERSMQMVVSRGCSC